MGGRLALGWASRYSSSHLSRLILISSSFGPVYPREWFFEKNSYEFFEHWYEQDIFRGIKEHKNYPKLLKKKMDSFNPAWEEVQKTFVHKKFEISQEMISKIHYIYGKGG